MTEKTGSTTAELKALPVPERNLQIIALMRVAGCFDAEDKVTPSIPSALRTIFPGILKNEITLFRSSLCNEPNKVLVQRGGSYYLDRDRLDKPEEPAQPNEEPAPEVKPPASKRKPAPKKRSTAKTTSKVAAVPEESNDMEQALLSVTALDRKVHNVAFALLKLANKSLPPADAERALKYAQQAAERLV